MEVNFSNPDFCPGWFPLGRWRHSSLSSGDQPSKLVPATSHEYGGHHPDYDGMKCR